MNSAKRSIEVVVRYRSINLVHVVNDYRIEDEMLVFPEGVVCLSFPRQPTSGPQDDPAKFINVGVAAHITAASPDGPRFDPGMTADQRCAAEKGIWLCRTCAN